LQNTSKEYYRIGKTAYQVIISGLNRLIGYIRSEKGQYWLEDYPDLDNNCYSEFINNKVRIRFDGGEWIELRSERVVNFSVVAYTDKKNLIAKEDWLAVQDYLQSGRRVSLVGHLLSIAEKLSSEGYRRTALIEAVSALEVALHQFAKEAADKKPAQCRDVKTGFSNIKKHIEYICFTCSFNYLLPLILKEGAMEALKQCQEAIEERGNVVHNGQRDGSPEKLKGYLRGVRSLCHELGTLG
jgi:hypothetical protein